MNKELINNFAEKWYGQVTFAVLSAILLILSTSGFGYSYFVFIAFIPVLYALSKNNSRPVITGWIIGFLYWTVCLSWMTITFGYFGGAPLPAAIALLLLVALSGGFMFFVPYTYLASKGYNPFILAFTFVLLEAVKGAVFFGGVPWLNLAQSQYENTLIIQNVSVFGEYGLSFIIMLINIFLFKIITDYKNKLNYIVLAVTVIIMILPGVYRYIKPLPVDRYINAAVVQPGYKQEIKWDNSHRLQIIRDINIQLNSINTSKTDLVVLPESSYPASVFRTDFLLNFLKDYSKKVPIVFGTDRRVQLDNKTVTYNSFVLLDNATASIYDKQHLTPFGEYFPFENLLKPMKEFFFGPGDMFTAGKESKVISVSNGIKTAPVICFESAFSELLRYPVNNGANIITVISNDTWFGKNQGKVQHLAVDVVRAVEYGRSVIRATQDGISAAILPNGVITEKVVEAKPEVFSQTLPLVSYNTFYSKFGNIWIAIIIPLLYYQIRKRKKLRKQEDK